MRSLIDVSNMKYQDFVNEMKSELFEEAMKDGGGLDGWSNYMGHDWSGWFCGPSYNRDSDILDISNFECALEELGGEVEGMIEIREVGHWACGRFKQIMIKADSKNLKAITCLYEIRCALERYPVLDDSDYSEREYESYSNYAEQTKQEIADSLLFLVGLDDGSIHWSKESEDLSSELLAMRKSLESEALELGYYMQLEFQMRQGRDYSLSSFGRWELEETIDGERRFSQLFKKYSETFDDLKNLGLHDSLSEGKLYDILNSILGKEK